MRIARPPEGFAIILSESAQQTLRSAQQAVPRIDDIWTGITERLKFTAHREGVSLKNGDRVYQIDADASFGIPRVALVYRVLGDAVTILRILISIKSTDLDQDRQ